MKTTVVANETAAWCVRIECTNGTTVRLTTYPFDLTMSNATVYLTDSGYEATAYQATSTMAPSAIDLEGIAGIAGISRDEIASGVFDGAKVLIFKTNFLSPVEDEEEVTAGWFGKATLEDEHYRIEGVSIVDALNESIAVTVTPGCRHTFGSQGYAECGIDLTTVDVTGTLTGITSSSVFRDSSRTEAADWFGAGTIRFTSGPNAGLKAFEIKSYAADGTITLHEPLYYVPTVGDAYVMTPGCRKTFAACVAHGNGINFGGFKDMPLKSTYTQIGTRF